MEININIKFPCSAEDWQKITQIYALSSLGHNNIGDVSQMLEHFSKPSKRKTLSQKLSAIREAVLPKADGALEVSDEDMIEELSKEQEDYLNEAVFRTHNDGSSEILDQLEVQGSCKRKASITTLVKHFLTLNKEAYRFQLQHFVEKNRPDLTESSIYSGISLAGTVLKLNKRKDETTGGKKLIWSLPEASHQQPLFLEETNERTI